MAAGEVGGAVGRVVGDGDGRRRSPEDQGPDGQVTALAFIVHGEVCELLEAHRTRQSDRLAPRPNTWTLQHGLKEV